MNGVLEIEVAGDQNEQLFFAPLQRRIRGRFDLNAVPEPLARMKTREYPQPIPGQRIGLDLGTGEGYVAEPLHEPVNKAIRERVERKARIAPERETFAAVHVPTWLFWLKRACESGIARVVKGKLPETIDGEPQKHFITRPPVNHNDRLAEMIECNTKVMMELLRAIKK